MHDAPTGLDRVHSLALGSSERVLLAGDCDAAFLDRHEVRLLQNRQQVGLECLHVEQPSLLAFAQVLRIGVAILQPTLYPRLTNHQVAGQPDVAAAKEDDIEKY